MMQSPLYLLTPPQIPDLVAFNKVLHQVLATNSVGLLQLRLKPATHLLTVIAAIKPICAQYNVPLIINDQITPGFGVHLGKDDSSVLEARDTLGNQTIGVSCYNSLERALIAGQQGADYVAFGAFYQTTTKQAETKATLDTLRQWKQQSSLTTVAIGGITPRNAAPLLEAGADMIAVCGGIWQAPNGPVKAVAEFQQLFDSLKNR